jgi:pimeloyl-ACP methyl ester carboxylesterase
MPHFDGRKFKMHFVEEGKGPAVVFVHEMGFDHTMYAAQFEDLPERYRCVAVDLRGHGRSELVPPPWTMQEVVTDLIAFLEGTNTRPAHLVGTSWGGMLALRTAIQREDLVRSLVLIGTSPEAEDPEWVQLYRGYERDVEAKDGVSEELARQTVPIFYGEPFVAAQPEAIEIHVDRLNKMPAAAIVESLRMVNDRESLVPRLGEVRVPTLVIHGELDSAVGIAHAETLAAGIAGADLVRVPDCGHIPSMEAPDIVNEAIAGFLLRARR